ncbi:MAG: DUF1491 family protein [Pseudomonadota bacterium]
MTEPRAATGLLVSALIRRIDAEGGSAMVIEKGDAIAGAVVLMLADRGVLGAIVERVWRFDGSFGFERVGPAQLDEPGAAGDYVARRRRSDPDLWVVEIDHPQAERIAGEVLL